MKACRLSTWWWWRKTYGQEPACIATLNPASFSLIRRGRYAEFLAELLEGVVSYRENEGLQTFDWPMLHRPSAFLSVKPFAMMDSAF
jgi:hypothetical protein